MASLTRQLLQLIEAKPVDNRDLETAMLFFLDAAASIIAGGHSEPGQKLVNWARGVAPEGKLVWLDDGRKAFLMGSLCHILEMDDLHRASVVHPGCVVAPAVLALAKGCDGKTALTAFVKGIEATTRVGMAVGPEHYKIWHNTATCGPYGSAVAAACLLNLNEDQCVDGLGNAGSQSAGFWQFLDSGAETKHLHAGRGAEAGLVSAQLAACGFSGAADILEGARGFFAATCSNPPVDNLLADRDGPWQVHQNSIKPWPSCRHTHPGIEVALELHKELIGRNKDISRVTIDTYQAGLNLCDRPDPQSQYAAKFSLHHCIGVALSDGKVDLGSFDEASRQRLGPLRGKVTVQLSDDFENPYPVSWGSRVTVHLADGTILSRQTDNAKGDPGHMLTDAEMFEKAAMLLDYAGFDGTSALLDQIARMPEGGPTPDVFSLI
jgi:2-methylcitrate dehydratase PrpD